MTGRPNLQNSVLLAGVALLSCAALVGCQKSPTAQRVSDKQDAVAELAENIQDLETNKEQRVAEAARAERSEIEATLEKQRAQLAKEQKDLAELMQRKAFETEAEANLATLKTRLNEVEAMASEAEGQEEAALKGQAAALQTHHDQLQQEIEKLKTSQGDGWKTQQIQVREAWDQAKAAVTEPPAATVPPSDSPQAADRES